MTGLMLICILIIGVLYLLTNRNTFYEYSFDVRDAGMAPMVRKRYLFINTSWKYLRMKVDGTFVFSEWGEYLDPRTAESIVLKHQSTYSHD